MYLKRYYNAGVGVLESVLILIYSFMIVLEQVKVNRKMSKTVENLSERLRTAIVYERNGVINGIILRPVLKKEPVGLVDRQALPPYSWCSRCGGEVYRENDCLCGDCTETEETS